MPQSPKIFIYNGLGTAEPLVADLKELLTVNNIFPEKPDVTTCDFSFNPEGLSKPMLVVPGGSTSVIGLKIQSQMAKFKSLFDENFHYLGVCAGAFLGANDADLFLATHEYDKKSGELKDPEFFISTKSIKVNFSAIDDVNACGAFYPHDKYFKNERGKKYMPYRVSLQLNSNEKINQVYLAGPGFFKQHTEQKSEVVATYSDKESYQFSYENEKKEFKQFAAWVRKKNSEKQGGRFLAGTHIETCVPNSKGLQFLQHETNEVKPLDKLDYEILQKEQEKSRAIVVSLLRETFR